MQLRTYVAYDLHGDVMITLVIENVATPAVCAQSTNSHHMFPGGHLKQAGMKGTRLLLQDFFEHP